MVLLLHWYCVSTTVVVSQTVPAGCSVCIDTLQHTPVVQHPGSACTTQVPETHAAAWQTAGGGWMPAQSASLVQQLAFALPTQAPLGSHASPVVQTLPSLHAPVLMAQDDTLVAGSQSLQPKLPFATVAAGTHAPPMRHWLAATVHAQGAPGPRPQYSATYYAAFVRDPDGHRLEAVCQ